MSTDLQQFQNHSEVIIGIDPGTKITGFGIIKKMGHHLQVIDFGAIRPPAHLEISQKNLIIFESITLLLKTHRPMALSIETQYVHPKNYQAGIIIGMTRGVIVLAAKLLSIPVFEYPPLKAKKSVVGKGNASKNQVGYMVKNILNLKTIPQPEDAADALALAICHTHYKGSL